MNMKHQTGVVLIVSMIMLIIITLVSLSSFKLTKSNLQIAGNQQRQYQTLTAAEGAIETALSTTQFTTTPDNAIANPCGGQANTLCFDMDGRGQEDVKVTLAPACVSTQVIPVTQLDFTSANDAGCLLGSNQNQGIDGAVNGNSLCSNMLWDVQATAVDSVNNTKKVVSEGVAVRRPSSTVCP